MIALSISIQARIARLGALQELTGRLTETVAAAGDMATAAPNKTGMRMTLAWSLCPLIFGEIKY
jgi:hypothetical protein